MPRKAKLPEMFLGNGDSAEWKFKVVSWQDYSFQRDKKLFFWHMVSRNGKVFFTGGEDLTKNNRDKAVEQVIKNWVAPLRVVYYDGTDTDATKLVQDYVKLGNDVS